MIKVILLKNLSLVLTDMVLLILSLVLGIIYKTAVNGYWTNNY